MAAAAGEWCRAQAPEALQFPAAQYKDFALVRNGSRLTAEEPNVHRTGPPEAQVIQDKDGYSEVNLPYMGIQLNVPFGWASRGGFNAMERIDFFPDPEHKSHGNLINSSITLGIKVLNSAGMGGTNFQGVLREVQSLSGQGGQFTTATDEPHHAFLIKIEKTSKSSLPVSTNTAGYYGLYLQDPNPGSTIWINVDLHAPQSEFEKYAGLLGPVYRDMKVNWAALEDYAHRHSAGSAGERAPQAAGAAPAGKEKGGAYLEFCDASVKLLNSAPGTTAFPAGAIAANTAVAPANYCMGYLKGVLETITMLSAVAEHDKTPGVMFCPPQEGVSASQALPIIVKYIKEHPEATDKPRVVLTMEALTQAYPCRKSP